MSTRLHTLMEQEGLEYGSRTHTYNSRLAQELAVAGDETGLTDPLHDALFRAYFVEGRNIGSAEVLFDIAESAGMDAAITRAVVEDRTNRDVVDEHWRRARSIGVTGVPTFVVDGQGVVGAQPYETLEELMVVVEVGKRALRSPDEPGSRPEPPPDPHG